MNTVMRPSHYRVRPREALSPRQREVLGLIARGWTNARIADHLGIGYESVKTHVSEILARLEVSSREDAVEAWRAERTVSARFRRALAPLGFLWSMKAVATGASLLGIAVAAVVLAAIVAVRGDDDAKSAAPDTATPAPTAAPAVTPPAVSRLSAWKRITDVPVGQEPMFAAAGFGSVWVANWGGTVSRIDPSTNQVTATISLTAGVGYIRPGSAGMWVSNAGQGVVWLIDPQTNSATEVVRLAQRPTTDRPCWMDVLETDGSLWTTDPVRNELLKFDATTFAAKGRYPMPHSLGFCPLAEISLVGGSLWIYNYNFEGSVQVDPSSGVTTGEWRGAAPPVDAGGTLWIHGQDSLARLDLSAKTLGQKIPAEHWPSRVAAADGLVWATISKGNGVIVFDTATGETSRISTGKGSEGVMLAFGSAWVTNQDENTVTRVSAAP